MRYPVAALVLGAALGWTAGARAEPSADVARADALFKAARTLSAAGQYADACPKFAESKRLARGVGVALYLADCYERWGHTASAWREFLAAEKLARDRDDGRAAVAEAHVKALEPRLNRLTIRVEPTPSGDGPRVVRDGDEVGADEWNLPVPVDPGDHVIVVSIPGRLARVLRVRLDATRPVATIRVDAAPGGAADVSVDGADALPAGPPAESPAESVTDSSRAAAAQPPEKPAGDGLSTRRAVSVGLMGAGALVISVGTAFAIGAASPSTGDGSAAFQTASTVSFITGAAALVTGIILYLTQPAPSPVPSPTN